MNAIYFGEMFVDMSGEKLISELKFQCRMKNSRQTDSGALNCQSGKVFLPADPIGNTANTIKFVENLINQYPQARLVLIWDGATYHYSQEFRDYLESVNLGKTEEEWLLKCIRLAPNAPEQNQARRCLVTS
jgi:hypothetical protein